MTNVIRHEAQRVRGRESGGDRGHGRHLETYIKFFERSHPVSVPVILFISYSVSAFISDPDPIPVPDPVLVPPLLSVPPEEVEEVVDEVEKEDEVEEERASVTL